MRLLVAAVAGLALGAAATFALQAPVPGTPAATGSGDGPGNPATAALPPGRSAGASGTAAAPWTPPPPAGAGGAAPRAATPGAGGPGAGAPQVGWPQAGGPGAGAPQAGGPQAGGPQAGGPGAGAPQAGGPQAGDPSGRPSLLSEQQVLLAWTAGGLPPGFAEAVAALPLLDRLTVVRGDPVGMVASWDADGRAVDRTAAGFRIPLDTIAVDTATYPALLPQADRSAFVRLGPGDALLGETSARIRRLGAGATVELAGGVRLVVAGVVPDSLVGAAELVLPLAGADRAGVTTARYLLLSSAAARDDLEAALREVVPTGTALRVRGPGETPWLRHGDAVLPQAGVKERFGEWSYRPGPGRDVEQDPAWTAAHIVHQDVPILGEVACHRALIPALRGAMGELEQDGLAWLVDPAQYAGCWVPRLIAAGSAPSRHAWGLAVDLNTAPNPQGVASAQDPRLVETMERWGFTWGGPWLVPDAQHFEFVHPPG